MRNVAKFIGQNTVVSIINNRGRWLLITIFRHKKVAHFAKLRKSMNVMTTRHVEINSKDIMKYCFVV